MKEIPSLGRDDSPAFFLTVRKNLCRLPPFVVTCVDDVQHISQVEGQPPARKAAVFGWVVIEERPVTYIHTPCPLNGIKKQTKTFTQAQTFTSVSCSKNRDVIIIKLNRSVILWKDCKDDFWGDTIYELCVSYRHASHTSEKRKKLGIHLSTNKLIKTDKNWCTC